MEHTQLSLTDLVAVDRPMMGDYYVIESIYDGRFAINKTGLFDTVDNIIYSFPEGVDFRQVVLDGVPGLSAGVVSAFFLYLLTIKPMRYMPDAVLTANDNGITYDDADVAYIAHLEEGEFLWQVPDGGVAGAFYTTYRHVPFATDYIVNDAGVVRRISTNEELVLGTGFTTYNIVTDTGQIIAVEPARLVIWAWGKYNEKNWLDTIYFIDGDETKLNPDNLALGVTVTTGFARLYDEDVNENIHLRP
jgi:hypothetical protein